MEAVRLPAQHWLRWHDAPPAARKLLQQLAREPEQVERGLALEILLDGARPRLWRTVAAWARRRVRIVRRGVVVQLVTPRWSCDLKSDSRRAALDALAARRIRLLRKADGLQLVQRGRGPRSYYVGADQYLTREEADAAFEREIAQRREAEEARAREDAKRARERARIERLDTARARHLKRRRALRSVDGGVLGWRAFRLTKETGEWMLVSPHRGTPWTGPQLEAEGMREDGPVRNQAGIHACWSRREAAREGATIARVLAYGRICAGREGWRAERVVITRVIVPPIATSVRDEILAALRARYQCRVGERRA